MHGYRDTDIVRSRVGVKDPSKIPEVVELTVVPYIYYIFFEIEEIVELGGALRDGVLIAGESDKSQINKKHKNDMTEEGQGSGGNKDEQMQDNVEMQRAELAREADIRKEMLERKKVQDEAGIVAQSKGLEEINKEFAEDAEKMDFKNDGYSQEQTDYGEDMLDSTQVIQERVLREYGNYTKEVPGSEPEKIASKVTILSDTRQVNKQTLGESLRDMNKSKEGVVDEERRRTQRNIGDMNVMDKVVGRVKVKNLETIPGMDSHNSSPFDNANSSVVLPTVLDTAHGKLVEIASGLGFKLGGNEVEIVNNAQHLKNLEASRLSVYNASINKHKESTVVNNNIS